MRIASRVIFRIPHKLRELKIPLLPKVATGTLVTLAAIGPILFQSTSNTLQHLQSGYDPVRDAISTLVFGRFGWMQTDVFYLFALSLLALTLLFFLVVKVKFNAGAIMLALAAVCFIIIGLNHSQGAGTVLTMSAMIHRNTTIAVLFIFPLACFLLSPSLKARGYSGLYYYTLGTGGFFVLFFVAGGIILVERLSLFGIYERVLLWSAQLWMEIVCAQMIFRAIKERARSRFRIPAG